MITLTRPVAGAGRHHWPAHLYYSGSAGPRRSLRGTPGVTVPLPVALPGGRVFAGMDPSDPSTYVRPWNPQPGMIGRLNFDGAMTQGYTATGVRGNPASWDAVAGARPGRRPR